MNTARTMAWKVDAYLAARRQAGFALRIEGEQLKRFARFADQRAPDGALTVKLATQWASASRRPGLLSAARRIEVLRGFAKYCQQFDPTIEIPPRRLFGRPHRRLTPHIYTEAEIRALMAATAHLHPPGGLRGATCATIFGLIAATGLRISEATGLMRADVDFDRALLHIRHAKFGKERWVALHPTTVRALQRYCEQRDHDPLAAGRDAFFLFDYGRPALERSVQYAFRLLRRQLRWRARGGHPAPRIHDIRHYFVCRRLEQWCAQGLDIDRNILALSTYIGHAKITDTYWYVTATPKLLATAAQRFERHAGGAS
jgi:integrase